MSIRPLLFCLAAVLLGLSLSLPHLGAAGSPEMNVQAVLVWGTNGEKPPNKNLKELEPELARKLSKSPYKWKNYFEVDRRLVTIPTNTSKRVPMSEHCELDVKNLGDDRIEV